MRTIIRRAEPCAALATVMLTAACAVGPATAPSVMALPKEGENLAVFQAEDDACRAYAAGSPGGAAAVQQGNNAAVGSAVVGTGIGAAAGAALGSLSGQAGAGAVVGGVTGALIGSAVGANQAQAGSYLSQQDFDTHYTQCMVARGYAVQAPPANYALPAYGYGGYGYPPVVVAPSVGLGWGWGWGGGYRPYWGGGGYRPYWGGGGWRGPAGGWHP